MELSCDTLNGNWIKNETSELNDNDVTMNDKETPPTRLRTSMDKVLNYSVLLEEILTLLKSEDLRTCSAVCLSWYHVSRRIETKRRQLLQICLPFRMIRYESENSLSAKAAFTDIKYGMDAVNESLNGHIKKVDFKPDLMILIEGNNNKNGKKRKWKRAKCINYIRASLPTTCKVVGIDAHYGILGTPKNDELSVIDYKHSLLAGINCILLPKYNGVQVQVFDRLSELEPNNKLKALILLSSGVSFYGDYLEHQNVRHLFKNLKGNFAMAGAQVNDKLTTILVEERFSDDTANYYFTNGRPPYNPNYNPQKMSLIGIQFIGDKVKAYSAVIRPSRDEFTSAQDDMLSIEYQLKHLKLNSDFDFDDQGNEYDVMGFIFFNYNRFCASVAQNGGDVNYGVKTVQKIFPRMKLFGILSHAQYEYNYWPNINAESQKVPYDENNLPVILPSPTSIASFMVVCLCRTG